MPVVGLNSRVFYREKPSSISSDGYWVGSEYKWVGNPKSIPNPMGEANMVDVSGLEDWVTKQIEGRRGATDFTVQLPFEDISKFIKLAGKDLDVVVLYGSQGKGELGAVGFRATVTATPDEANENELTCSVKFSLTTQATFIHESYTFTVANDSVTGYPADTTPLEIAKKSS